MSGRQALEERKVGMEERSKLLEWEKHSFFLDTSLFNDAQKEYVNLVREQVLIQKRAMIMGDGGLDGMGGGDLGGMGGISAMVGFGATMGGMGSMGGFGATMETMGGMGGFGPPPGGLDGMGGMSFAALIGGMGAPPGAGVPPSHGLGNTFRASRDVDAARNNGEEEEESSSAESNVSEEDEDEDEA